MLSCFFDRVLVVLVWFSESGFERGSYAEDLPQPSLPGPGCDRGWGRLWPCERRHLGVLILRRVGASMPLGDCLRSEFMSGDVRCTGKLPVGRCRVYVRLDEWSRCMSGRYSEGCQVQHVWGPCKAFTA